MKKILKYTAALLLVLILCGLMISPVASAEEYESEPYDTYMYWTSAEGSKREAAPIRELYTVEDKVYGFDLGIEEFSEPADLDTDSKGNVYILDADNARVVVLTPQLKLIRIISAPTVKGEELDFSGARGIYLDREDQVYVCDTNNGRVLVFDKNGKYTKQITLPESDVVPDDFNFAPTKLVMDSRGYIFVLSDGSYYGAVVYDEDGNFLGFYGANYVQATVLDFLAKLWDRMTQTEAKRAASVQKLPYQFISMDIDQSDFIYTLTGKTENIYSSGTGHIRRLNPAGSNIYKNSSGKGSESLDFTDAGDFKTEVLMPYLTDFKKLCVDKNDFVYAVDAQFGHIFIYDSQCNNIGVFGGGGRDFICEQKGTFERASSIVVYGDMLYVTDAEDCSITSFRITDYGKMYIKAQKLTLDGNYPEAKPLWEQILSVDKNNQLAYIGLAQAALFEGDNTAALDYAETGLDQNDYAVAFQQKRSEFFADNVWWIIVLVVVLAIGIFIWIKLRGEKEKNPDHPVRFALNTVIHPFDSFYRLKYKGAGSLGVAFLLMLLYYVAMVVSEIYSGFSFSIFDPADYNSLLTLVRTIGLVVVWTAVNWGVCILAQGKGYLKEIFMVTCYALIPEIIGCVLKLILTNILVPEEAAIMTILMVCCHILTAVVLCVGIMAVHEYDFFRFLWTTVVSVLGILLIVFIIFMIFILTRELSSFIGSIVKEALYQ